MKQQSSRTVALRRSSTQGQSSSQRRSSNQRMRSTSNEDRNRRATRSSSGSSKDHNRRAAGIDFGKQGDRDGREEMRPYGQSRVFSSFSFDLSRRKERYNAIRLQVRFGLDFHIHSLAKSKSAPIHTSHLSA